MVELDAGPPWGSGSNQRWFNSLSVRWCVVEGSVPSQKPFFVLSLIPHIRPQASQEALFFVFLGGHLAPILLIAVILLHNRICAVRPGDFSPISRLWVCGTKTHEIGSAAKHNDTVVHLLTSPTQGLCSNSGQLSKGHHASLSGCVSWGSSPARGTAT